MKKSVKGVLVALAVLACAVLALKASVLIVQSGSWSQTGNLSSARVGASAALLPDGRILVTGGDPGTGPLATADFFGTDGTISAAPAMVNARSSHVSVALQDGRVLVAGGLTAGGSATNAAEIYDPVQNSWTSIGAGMIEARSGATAAVLQDGRVAIAGGQNGTIISSTIEIFDPAHGTFTYAGMMSSPRSQHAMAELQDGRVLIVGGNRGNTGTPPAPTPVASTDIFDPVTGTVSAGPSLTTARYNHSATTLLNGQVVVIGGNNGNTNPAQMDVTPAELIDFTAATPAFTTLATNLATPREGYLAFLLPNNNNILIVGGTSGGTTIASAELFTAQGAPPSVWTYSFASTGTMTAARSSASGSANQVNATSTVMQRNGVLMVAGGADANGNALISTEAYGYATVQTDATEYAPGSPVTITGSGWVPGETVTLSLLESPYFDTHPNLTAVADANGDISNNQFSPDLHDIGISFFLTATGATSGFVAQNMFADNSITVASSPSGITYTLTWTGYVGTSKSPSTKCTGTIQNGPTQVPGVDSSGQNLGIGNPDSIQFQAPSLSDQGTPFQSWTVPSGAIITVGSTSTATICVETPPSGTYTATYSTAVPKPTLSSISPTTGGLGEVVTETLTGTNFVADSAVIVTRTGGSGITVGTPTINSSTSITVSFTVASNATLGAWNVAVTNPTPGTLTGGGTSNAETFTVESPSKLAFTTTVQTLTAGVCSGVLTVQSQDASGDPSDVASTETLTPSASPATGATFYTNSTCTTAVTAGNLTIASGSNTASFFFEDTVASSPVITVAGSGAFAATGSNAATQTETVNAAGANKLAFLQQPTATAANSTMTPAVTVQIEDQFGNVTTTGSDSTRTVSLAIGNNPSSGTLTGGAGVAAAAGMATFSSLSINNPGTGYTLVATSTGLTNPTVTSNPFNINAANGSGTMTVSPITANAGSTGNSFAFTFTANNGNFPSGSQVTLLVPATWTQPTTNAGAGNVVVANLTGTSCAPSIGTISGSGPWTIPINMACNSTNSFTLTYSSVTAPTPSATTQYTFTTQSKDGSGGTLLAIASSPVVTVNANALDHFLVAPSTSTPTSNVPFSVTVTAQTVSNTTVTGYTGTIHFSLTNPDTGATIPVNYTFVAGDSGAHTFTNGVNLITVQSETINVNDTVQTTKTGSATVTVGTRSTTTTLTLTPASINFGQSTTANVTVTDSASGTASNPQGTITFNTGDATDTVGTCTITNANPATCSAPITPTRVGTGSRSITATFTPSASDTTQSGSTSSVQSLTVNQAATTTSLSAPTVTYPANGVVTVTVSSTAGTPMGNATLIVDGGTPLTQALNGSGVATFTLTSPSAGIHTLSASYAAQGNFAASGPTPGTLTVNAAATTTSISAPTVTYPANGVVTVTVSSTAGTPTGNATLIVDGGTPLTQALNGSGVATFTLTGLNPGGHMLSASYAAQGNFAASGPTPGTLIVDAVPMITSAASTTFTAAVAGTFTVTTMAFPTASLGETGSLPAGVTFTDNGDGTATLAGTATVAGSYPITITAANVAGSAMQMFTLTVSPGAFAQLQLLVPGETAAPGTTSGKTGTPNTEYVNGAFNVTVNAVDANWNLVNTVTDTVAITSNDSKAKLPSNAALVVGTGTFSVTLETVSNPATTTITASDATPNTAITPDTSPAIEVIVVYTATISPTMTGTGDATNYTLTVNNAPAPNANSLASVEIAVPAADQGSISTFTVNAANVGPTPVNWTVDSSKLPATLRFFETTANDAVTPGGTITITFTATSNATVSTMPVYEVWNTTAFSDAASSSPLPLAPPEPTVSIGVAPMITSASSTSAFTYGTAGTTFTVTATGTPTPSLSETGSFPSWATFKDNGNGTATISGTPTAAGTSTFTITAHSGFGPDASQYFNLTVIAATVMPSITASNKVYDGTTTASVTCTLMGVLGTDNVTCSAASANFSQVGVGTGLTVTATGITLGGTAAGNYQLSSTTATTTASISTRPITAALKATNKTYDGTAAEPNANMSCTLTGVLPADSNYVSCAASYGTFNTSKVATANLVTATVTISGTAAGNYTLGAGGTTTPSTTGTAPASITPALLTVAAIGVNKIYDGTTAATVTLTDNRISGDMFTDSYLTATFADANAGNGKPVTVMGISIAGTDAGNYVLFSTTAVTTANITAAQTMTSVSSSLNPSTYGDSVTFTAIVSNTSGTAVAPTGSVQFVIDGGAAIPGTAGSCPMTAPAFSLCATYSTSTLTVSGSPHTVTANYMNADPNFSASSGSLTGGQTVQQANSATMLAVSSGTTNLGDLVTLTATVTDGTSGSTGTPTGLVVFLDGTTPIGTGTLSSGVGTFTTSLLAVGSHSITAAYQGDANFKASATTGATSEMVGLRPSTTMVTLMNTPSPNGTVVVGQSSTVTATVTDNGTTNPPGAADTWVAAAGTPATGATGSTATLFADGMVLVAGGTASGTAVQSAYIYNATSRTFSATGILKYARTGATATLLPNGEILIAGGSSDGTAGGALNTAELYNPVAGTFAVAGAASTPPNVMTAARFGATATLLTNGKVLIAGGQNSGALSSAELYDPTADTFTPTGSLGTARYNAAAVLLITGKVLIVGGMGSSGVLTSAELFDPTGNSNAGTFSGAGNLNTMRTGATATLLLNGNVLIAGGSSDGTANGALNTAELYVDGNFSPSSSMLNTARFNGTATLLPNGMVLLVGGASGSSAELYDADSGKFDTTGSLMQADQASLTATLLNKDHVLVTGLTSGAPPVADTELYTPSFDPLGSVALTSSDTSALPDSFVGACVLAIQGGGVSTCTSMVTPAEVGVSPHTITGAYPTDAVHSGNSNTASLTVNKANTLTTVTSSPSTSVYGGQVTFSATVSVVSPGAGAPTESVQFVVDGSNYGSPVSLVGEGASITDSALTAGTHSITASYSGDGNFNKTGFDAGSTATTATQQVNKAQPAFSNLTASQTITYGTPSISLAGTISAPCGTGCTVYPPTTETVSITINGVTVTPAIGANGSFSATFATSTIPASATAYTITYSYNTSYAETNFKSATDASTTLTVNKAQPVFSNLTASQTITYGTPSINLAGTISAPCGTGCAVYPPTTETVSIMINGVTVTPAIGSNGSFSATFTTSTIPASATAYSITYSYNKSYADTNFKSATDVSTTLTVKPVPLNITAASGTMTYGGTLPTINTGNATYASFVNGEGVSVLGAGFSCSTTATSSSSVGTFATNCSGAVDSNYIINYTPGTITVKTAPLTITASSGSMTYGSSPFVVMPIFSGLVNGDTPTTFGVSPNVAPVCLPVLSSTSSAMTYTSTCTGAVDNNYSITTMSGSVTVMQATTMTTVTSSTDGTSIFLQPVTFTATVADSSMGSTGTPTGTVAFYDAGSGATCNMLGSSAAIGTPQTLINGSASVTTATLTGAPASSGGQQHNILACYTGDINFLSSPGTITQTVDAVPVVTTSPSSNSFTGQNVGTTSSPFSFTVSNIGDAPLDFASGSPAITGDDPLEFSIYTKGNPTPSYCGSTLAAGSSCTIQITFTPKDTGEASAILQITDNNELTGSQTTSQQNITLTGGGLSTLMSGGSLYNYAIFATQNSCGSITMNGNTVVDSFNSASGYSSSHQLGGGNVGTNGNVTLNGNATVDGSAAVDYSTTGNCSKNSITGVSMSGGAKVVGGQVPLNGPITYPAPPAPNPAPPTTNQNISGACPSGMTGCANTGSKAVTLTPGSYGNVQFSGGTTAYVSEGVYNFNSLALSGNSVLHVNSGPVVINLAGASLSGGKPAVDLSGGSIVNPTLKPSNLEFFYAGSQGVNLSGGSQAYATVYAPNAPTTMSGGTDFFGSVIAGTLINSGGTALHFDTNLTDVMAGDSLWLTIVANNVQYKGAPLTNAAGQVKLYLTNSTISFAATASQCSGSGGTFSSGTCTLPVPNAVVTLNSASKTSPTTNYDLTNNRWSTSVPPSDLTGNTFVTGVAVPVPAGLPAGIQNVKWSSAFSTDTANITLQWQWSAGVYTAFNSCYAFQNTNNSGPCYNSASNSNVLGVNAEDGSADTNGTDPAGTPETYKQDDVIGFFSAAAGVTPAAAEMSTAPSNYAFTPQAHGTSSPLVSVSVITNNDGVTHNFVTPAGEPGPIYVAGTNMADFALQSGGINNCIGMTSLAAGSSCNLYVVFTPQMQSAESAKIVIDSDANNSPQTVYLSGTGQ